MIDFKNKDDVAPSSLIVASLVILTGTAIFMLVVPPPQVSKRGPSHASVRRNLTRQAQRSDQRAKDLEKSDAKRLWQGDDQQVTTAVLAQMTERTHQYGLTLASFRPQHGQQLPGLIEGRYNAQVSGPYAHVANLLAAIDGVGTKIVLTSVQVSPSGNNAGAVTASIALSSYAPGPAELPTAQGSATATRGGTHG